MDKKRKVGFATKLLSNRNYLSEVSVEGKTTSKFNFKIGFYDQYAAQIIRSGNCITLLSNTITLNKDTFWNTNFFEDLTRYVFWTFNKSFLLTLQERINTLSLPTLNRCIYLLQENFTPYDTTIEESVDEELQWCLVKNGHLENDPKFNQMYLLDKENRTALFNALKEKITSFETKEDIPKIITEETAANEVKTVLFVEMLKPINNSSEATLDFIISKWTEAEFKLNIFSKVDKSADGKNAHGLNGAIAAMIDFFWKQNYFKEGYNMEEIFKAYFTYSSNYIAKFRTVLSHFREDNYYIEYFNKLKQLKINKMK